MDKITRVVRDLLIFGIYGPEAPSMERRAVVIRGVVQGVGFRPFVYALAGRFHVSGFVKNQTGSVFIEAEGEPQELDRFLSEIAERPPPLAHIESLSWELREPIGERGFRVDPSENDGESPIFLSPDAATCADCLAELFNPDDRRYLYPFLNCTNCGPRLTIITGAPYDRRNTTMSAFPMCDACLAEYEDPANRRFHAEPTACAACGPRLQALDAAGKPLETDDPLGLFADALIEGRIGALKGLGGFHLVCDARNPSAVAEVRRLKRRDEKPFAVMVRDADEAAVLCEIGPAERSLLTSPRAPIVLLRKRSSCAVDERVAPGNPWLGVMLPYTPLHHLLMRAVGGRALVMTSGNRSDEPIAYRDDAAEVLGGIADVFLTHDRAIHVRCDDSVTRVIGGVESLIRRSRGSAPRPIELPFTCDVPVLAVGGQLKATFALGRDRQAFVSHHMGDLDDYDAYMAFETDAELYQRLFSVVPGRIVHDLHPDYITTRYARNRADAEKIPALAVQHHHAHMSSCMAEHGLNETVIGVTFDGTGYGTDGAVWGGEFLVGDYKTFRRGAHLRYVGMPGGDRAVREPWRMAAAHLADADAGYDVFKNRIKRIDLEFIERMLERRVNTPYTSSAGRLFDAIAVLACGRDRVSYEGQAAVELEWLATGIPPDGVYPFEIGPQGADDAPRIIDVRPLIRAVAKEATRGVSAALIARQFHSTLVDLIATVCGRLREVTGIGAVVLSGGVFLNALLTAESSARLCVDGFRVYRHRLTPPNDGGLSLGQLAVAAALIAEESVAVPFARKG